MKKVLVTFAQFLLFLLAFAVGSFLHPFNLHWATTTADSGATRYFVADGLLLSLGIFVAFLAIQAIRKRTCDTPWTIVAFLLSTAIGYAIKLGFVTREL
ncbi:hypothetical protein [Edaphobacter flagellatus]|uniref:hypothetical protein n=1 Tax=Edaphobacter flagellatus TaxID=1933044 RepID=UPI0021B1A3DA|nr:hypothetical protein [Edaphobacter flagellatus]